MKIAQVAPLYESCPPKHYGGTERVVSYLTDELVRLGHTVTLFASGDSITDAELQPGCDQALWHAHDARDPLPHHFAMIESVRRRADEFDIIHFHTEYLHFPFFSGKPEKTITTLHGRLDLSDSPVIYRAFPKMPLISISNAQRAPMPWARWQQTVYHGLPRQLHRTGRGDGGYLAFLGRVSPEKGLDKAIEIALRAGLPLQIGAKVDPKDHEYYERVIAPLLNNPLIEFVGEVSETDKVPFLGDAIALLFPIDWPEPFGLVMIEAMATGTPVIAYNRGSVPELIEPGVTGFIVDDVEAGATAIPLARALDRAAIRQEFEERFSVERMTLDYLEVYQRLLDRDSVQIELNAAK